MANHETRIIHPRTPSSTRIVYSTFFSSFFYFLVHVGISLHVAVIWWLVVGGVYYTDPGPLPCSTGLDARRRQDRADIWLRYISCLRRGAVSLPRTPSLSLCRGWKYVGGSRPLRRDVPRFSPYTGSLIRSEISSFFAGPRASPANI